MSGAPKKMGKPSGTKRRIRRGSVNDNDRGVLRTIARSLLAECRHQRHGREKRQPLTVHLLLIDCVAEFRAAAQAGISESDGFDEETAGEHQTLDAACQACARLGPPVEMRERTVLYTDDEVIPPGFNTRQVNGGTVRIFKSTYAANDPNEDRNTLAVGDDFIFAGVWDG